MPTDTSMGQEVRLLGNLSTQEASSWLAIT
jgi:hypothetical protein